MRPGAAPEDLDVLALRLALGLPLRGFDGRDIPLRYRSGHIVEPIEAAVLLMISGASLLPGERAAMFTRQSLILAEAAESAARLIGDTTLVVERTTHALVARAICARVIAAGRRDDEQTLTQAISSWYDVSNWHRAELVRAWATGTTVQSATS